MNSETVYARVVNIEQPVETHVNAEGDVDQVFVLLFQPVVDGRQAVDDVGDGKEVTVVGEFVLLEGALGNTQIQQVHWKQSEGKDMKTKIKTGF